MVPIALAAAGCDTQADAPVAEADTRSVEAAPAGDEPPVPSPVGDPSFTTTPTPTVSGKSAEATPDEVDCAAQRTKLTPEATRSETGARSALLDWSRELENGRFERSWCQFARNGAASGMTLAQYRSFWGRFESLTVAAPTGRMEGATGTSYYTAPARVTARTRDGAATVLEGDVVLSRVNDVPGATAEQLSWTIRSADLTQTGR